MTANQPAPTQQLQTIVPEAVLRDAAAIALPPGYELRTFRAGDEDEFVSLLKSAGFDYWTRDTLSAALQKALPEGIFIAVHAPTGALAATAMATHNPAEHHPFGGELGWVAGHPDHRGHRLGAIVCTAVIRRFAQAGYSRVYLKTDDFRLPAIRTYLKLGLLPFINAHDMESRWRAVCEKLSWPFTPERWPRVPFAPPPGDQAQAPEPSVEPQPAPVNNERRHPVLDRTRKIIEDGGTVRMILYGDSISEVGRTPAWFGGASCLANNYGQQLAAMLREGYPQAAFEAINFGVGGQNTYEGLGRIDYLAPLKPDLVLLEFGANDAGFHFLIPEETQLALKTLVEWIQWRHSCDVVVVGMGGNNPLAATPACDPTIAVQRRVAEELHVPFAHLRTALLAATDNGRRWADFHMDADNCHPNDRGHRVWAEAMFAVIQQNLRSS